MRMRALPFRTEGRDAVGPGYEDERCDERRDARPDERLDGRAFVEPGWHGARRAMAPAFVARRRQQAAFNG